MFTNEDLEQLKDWWSRYEKIHPAALADPEVDGYACRLCGDSCFTLKDGCDWEQGESFCDACAHQMVDGIFKWMPKLLKALVTKEQVEVVLAWLKKVEGAGTFQLLRSHGHDSGPVSERQVADVSAQYPSAKAGYSRLQEIADGEKPIEAEAAKAD